MPLVDVRIDLGKFADLCRKQKADNPDLPYYGFDSELIKSFALQSADRPFVWSRSHKQFFDKISGEIVLHNNKGFDDGVYFTTELEPETPTSLQ